VYFIKEEMPRIYFLRHAQATHNLAALSEGPAAYHDIVHRDAALTDTGHEQAFNVNFGETVFDAIYCSPLRRCRQTLLNAVPAAVSRTVCLDDRLMEPQGSHICNWREAADVVAHEVPAAWRLDGVAKGAPWQTETRQEFRKRIIHFTEDLTYVPAASILVVAHHEWICDWFGMYAGTEIRLGNAEYVWADVTKKCEGGAWTVTVSSVTNEVA
jgi:broad specificity phosphatase PhoE